MARLLVHNLRNYLGKCIYCKDRNKVPSDEIIKIVLNDNQIITNQKIYFHFNSLNFEHINSIICTYNLYNVYSCVSMMMINYPDTIKKKKQI